MVSFPMVSFRPKPWTIYSPWFDFWESEKSLEVRIPSERASQEEQNGTNFSSVAPSCEELWVFKPIHSGDDLYHACT